MSSKCGEYNGSKHTIGFNSEMRKFNVPKWNGLVFRPYFHPLVPNSNQIYQALSPWNKSCYKFVECFSLCWLFNCSSMCQDDATTYVTHFISCNAPWCAWMLSNWNAKWMADLSSPENTLNCQFSSPILQKAYSCSTHISRSRKCFRLPNEVVNWICCH